MHTVTLSNNNSGGSYWLSEAQIDALLADGWRIDPNPSDWEQHSGRASMDFQLDVPVSDEDAAVTIAEIEFQRVTGEDPNEIGCTCCGQPFRFDTWQKRFPDAPDEEEVTVTVTVRTALDADVIRSAIEEVVAQIGGLSVEDVVLD